MPVKTTARSHQRALPGLIVGAMTVDPELLYLQLGELAETMPDLSFAGNWHTPDSQRWLGRAGALIATRGNGPDSTMFNIASQSLGTRMHESHAQTITAIFFRVLASAELAAPAAVRGRFIASGDTLGALGAITKVFATAKSDLLIVDAYADQVVITDFATSAPEAVHIRLLGANKEARKASLKPAAERWQAQFGTARQLSVRVAPAASLHDRLVLVDGADVWSLGQSFNGIAQRSHTAIIKVDPDLAKQKIAAY